MLLKDVNDLRVHLGRAINRATQDEFLTPFIQLAQDEFILPAIGSAMLDELDTQYNSTDSTALTPANRKLLTQLQRPLAWYAYTAYLPFAIGNDGDNGLQEQGTDKTQPVRIGVLDKRQRQSVENAANALETALLFLDFHRADYPTWTASDAYKATRLLFIRSASMLTAHLPQSARSYRLFLTLQPYLLRAEVNNILPVLGVDQYTELKAYQQTNFIVPEMETLLDWIRPALASQAYADALFHLNVTQTAGGALRILSDFDGIYNAKAVSDDLLQTARSEARAEATRRLKTLKTFLTKNADQYPTYKNSPAGQAPNPFDLPDNSSYKGIFRMR